MAITVPDFPFPATAAISKLAWFGVTLLLATPSDLDLIKDGSDEQIKGFFASAGIASGMQTDLLNFVRAIAKDPVLRAQFSALHFSLLNSPATRAVYNQAICPAAPASTEILRRMAQ